MDGTMRRCYVLESNGNEYASFQYRSRHAHHTQGVHTMALNGAHHTQGVHIMAMNMHRINTGQVMHTISKAYTPYPREESWVKP